MTTFHMMFVEIQAVTVNNCNSPTDQLAPKGHCYHLEKVSSQGFEVLSPGPQNVLGLGFRVLDLWFMALGL